jgi:hydroxymethylpyrimidine/phosphomethylpyrimidine kinase
MEDAARAIRKLGAHAVLVKGGHVAGSLVDVYYDGRSLRRLRGYRYEKELHGAGCTLAASIAGYLALGRPLFDAVEEARHRVSAGFQTSYRAGHGVEVINSQYRSDAYGLAFEVLLALPKLRRILGPAYPRWQLAFASPSPLSGRDVVSIRERGPAVFGATGVAVDAVVAAANVNPALRCAIGLRSGTRDARRLRATGLVMAAVGRLSRPQIERAIVWKGVVPDVLLGAGGRGRETMTLVLGKDPNDALRKLRRLGRRPVR